MTDRGDHDFWCALARRRTEAKARARASFPVLKQAGKASGGKSAVRRPTAGGRASTPASGSRLGRGHTARASQAQS